MKILDSPYEMCSLPCRDQLFHLFCSIQAKTEEILTHNKNFDLTKTYQRQLRHQLIPIDISAIKSIIKVLSYILDNKLLDQHNLLRLKIPSIGSLTILKKDPLLCYFHHKKKTDPPLAEGANNKISPVVKIDLLTQKITYLVERTSLNELTHLDASYDFYKKHPHFFCPYIEKKPEQSYFYYGHRKKSLTLKKCSIKEFFPGTYVDYVSEYYLKTDFDPFSFFRIFFSICLAVAHIKDMDLSHKDIKPSNIAIIYDEKKPYNSVTAKLIDIDDLGPLQPFFITGSSGFIPKDLHQVQDHKADIFALGNFLFLILNMIDRHFQNHFDLRLLEKLKSVALEMTHQKLGDNKNIENVIDDLLSIFEPQYDYFQLVYRRHKSSCL